MRRIARAGSVNTLGAGLGALLSIAFTWLIAHRVDQATAGTLFTAISVFLVAVALSELGADVSLAKFLPTFVAYDRWADTRFVIRLALGVAVAMSSLLAVGIALFHEPLGRILGTGSELVVLAVALPAAAAMNTALAAGRGLGTIRPTVLLDQLGRNAFQLALVTLATLGSGTLWLLGAAWGAPYLAGAVIAVWLLRGRLVKQPGTGTPHRSLAAEYASFTWPRAVSRVSQILLQRADIVLVAALRSPAEAAVYTVATRFLVIGQIFVQAVQQVLAPQASKLLGTGETEAAISVFRQTTAWVIALTWPVYLIAVAAGEQLLRVFGGDAYTSGTTVVAVLAAATLLSCAFGPVDVLLLMLGRSGISLVNSLLALATNLAVDLALIPVMGIEGAAIGWACAIVVRNLLGLWFVHRELRTTLFSRPAVLVGGLNLLVIGLPGVLAGPVLHLSGAALTGLLITCCGLYLAGLWQLRQVLGLEAFGALLPRRFSR